MMGIMIVCNEKHSISECNVCVTNGLLYALLLRACTMRGIVEADKFEMERASVRGAAKCFVAANPFCR